MEGRQDTLARLLGSIGRSLDESLALLGEQAKSVVDGLTPMPPPRRRHRRRRPRVQGKVP